MIRRVPWEQAGRAAATAAALLFAIYAPAVARQDEQVTRRDLERSGSAHTRAGYGLGWLPSTDAELARRPRFRIVPLTRGARPASLVLTDYLPPVGNQGGEDSCVGWSTGYYAYSYGVAKQRKLGREQLSDTRWQFSPAYIYNQINGGKDEGSHITKAFDLLKEQGCATMAEMPYKEKEFTEQPGEPAKVRAGRYRMREAGALFAAESFGTADPEALKTFLAEYRQPFVLGMLVFKDFAALENKDENFVYNLSIPATKENLLGGHAIAIIGYDDEKHAFRMVNSWTTGWGDHGFMWIAEDFIKAATHEGWGLISAGGPIARNPRASSYQLTPHISLEWPKQGAAPALLFHPEVGAPGDSIAALPAASQEGSE